ncbi:CBM96 family carbohydrate-binding protein [Klenkia brasiliensis]|uniref:Carbohydrate-binding module family 96 domain-containing protein n=1 Tax=Klenkia brasiliensis TaxID=333142 RepID=A0A1G7T761_9ACTN|nr:DNRLRE domain-containing protein [Klenkia brasiliensis]SDG31088.1 hypothetical protein SAMN05660324_2338 [Klenkia brasiliensis]
MSRPTWVRAAVLVLAAAGTVALTQVTSTAAFTASTTNTADQVGSGTWCVNPTTVTVTASEDATIRESPANANYGTTTTLLVRSGNGGLNRSLVRFALPTIPAGCTLSGVSLRLYLSSNDSVRSIVARRVLTTTSWSETAVTWSTQPTTTATGAATTSTPASPGWQTWPVQSIVTGLYAEGNGGIEIADADETTGNDLQTYSSREGSNPPQLVLSWG